MTQAELSSDSTKRKRKDVENVEKEEGDVRGDVRSVGTEDASASSSSSVGSEGGNADTRPFVIEDLPLDILLAVVSQLQGEDLARLAMTCKSWKRVANREYLWKLVAKKHTNWEHALTRGRPQLSWKKLYVSLYCLENGMCKNCFKRSRITHICKSEIEQELSNPIYNPPLCRFFPGLHHRIERDAESRRPVDAEATSS